MKQRICIHLFLWLILTGCVYTPHVSSTSFPVTLSSDINSLSLEQLSKEFKKLHAVKGQFEGGDWNQDVDAWMGREHRLMLEIESQVNKGKIDKAMLIDLMGPPDQVILPKDELSQLLIDLARLSNTNNAFSEILIYYWRGTHDYLYFIYRDDEFVHSGWWYSGE